MSDPSLGERLAVLEHKNRVLEEQYLTIDNKLDQLIGLRDKGLGAFWVASTLVGTGIISVLLLFVKWLKHL